jgi:hypothetical protein
MYYWLRVNKDSLFFRSEVDMSTLSMFGFLIILCAASVLCVFVVGFSVFLVLRWFSKRQPLAASQTLPEAANLPPYDRADVSDIPVPLNMTLPDPPGSAWSTPMPVQAKQLPVGSNYALYRPNPDFETRFKNAFVRKSPLSWPERQVFDALYAWVWDDVNTRYGDRFVLLAKVPLRDLVKSKTESLPLELQKVLDREADFVLCARGHKLKPVLAITIWAGSTDQGGFSSVLLPDQVVDHRDLTPQEWEQWIGAGLLQIAGIHSYLVSEKMALDWARVCRDFLTQLEDDIGTALKNSDVYGIE